MRQLFKFNRRKTTLGPLALTLVLTAALCAGQPDVAHANVMDKMKQWFQLPSQVDDLRDQYDATKQKLDQATKQLDQTTKQLDEAAQQSREAKEQVQQLVSDNERLAKQNDQLAQAIDDLQSANRQREQRSKQIWAVIGTAIALVAVYFILTRLLRLLLRSKHSS
ncbi:MAG: hypothetical protein K0Q59_1130 [Paenibacillus sp.]|jgi:septal ring factor EnvC (AmiA/AmiB activator)|nr:hypothetical protein [Paenibacillus sp.]